MFNGLPRQIGIYQSKSMLISYWSSMRIKFALCFFARARISALSVKTLSMVHHSSSKRFSMMFAYFFMSAKCFLTYPALVLIALYRIFWVSQQKADVPVKRSAQTAVRLPSPPGHAPDARFSLIRTVSSCMMLPKVFSSSSALSPATTD